MTEPEQDFLKKLKTINQLPTLPQIADNVIKMTLDPYASAINIGKSISQDQALAAKVLRTANSAFYGFPRKISTINKAILVLGFANIRNIVLSSSIIKILPDQKENRWLNRKEFWKHSLACGIAARMIAEHMKIKNSSEVFFWGLLHDIGKIILDAYFQKQFERILELADSENIMLRDAEKKILGVDHAEIGFVVADKWNLPPDIINAIRYHHEPGMARESTRLVSIVHLADSMCKIRKIGFSGDQKVPVIGSDIKKLLRINNEKIDELSNVTEDEIDSTTGFFFD